MSIPRHATALLLAAVATVSLPGAVLAQDAEVCGELPADPARVEVASEPDEELALDLSDKAYQAFSADDCHCTAWYNLKIYEQQPSAVLMQNIAAALERCGDLDAARRYASKTLELAPAEREEADARALVERLAAILAGPDFAAVSLANDYQVDALVFGHVAYRAGDAPVLPRGSHPVRVERDGQSVQETIQVPATQEVAGCTSDAACGSGERCELGTGRCVAAPTGAGVDPLLVAGLAATGGGVALLVTSLAIDAVVTPKRGDYDAMYDCLRDEGCGEARGTVDDFNALGDEIDTLVTAEIGTLIAGGALTVVGGALLLTALLIDDDDTTERAAGSDALVWGLAPRYDARGRLDGAWLDLALRF